MSILFTILSTLYVSSGMALLNNIPWNFIFFITQMFGLRLYIIHNKEEYLRIQKRIGKWCSHITDNNKGYGYSVGYWYILSLNRTISNSDGDTFTAWIFSTESSYENLTKDFEEKKYININKIEDKTTINIIDRLGSYWNVYFKKRTIKIPEIKPYYNQQIIINEIIDHQKEKKHTVVLLHGESGKGKSMIGLLLASQLNGNYCDSLAPWQPGDTIASLYAEAEVSEESPLILALEEIDIPILKIHEGIKPLKGVPMPIPVCDKSSWNTLMTHIERGMYPHLIIILTTNQDPKFFNDLDESYFRTGRVNKIFKVK